MDNKNKYMIFCKVESWEISYSIMCKIFENIQDIDSYSLNVKCKIDSTDCPTLDVSRILPITFGVDKTINNKKELIGLFLKSYKKWDGHIYVPQEFIKQFEFLINQNIMPYLDILCEEKDCKTLEVTSVIIHNMENRRK